MVIQLTESQLINFIKKVVNDDNNNIYEDIYGSVEVTKFKDNNFLLLKIL